MSSDSTDLEALFDSIASGQVAAPPSPVAAPVNSSVMQQVREGGNGATDDELQALFDSVASQSPAAADTASAAQPAESQEDWSQQDKVFHRVGQMARQLHDTLSQLGYDKLIEKATTALPDAKDRLSYIANLTEQAACKVLNATDVANPLQDQIEVSAAALGGKWDRLFANQMGVEEFKQLAAETRGFLKQELPDKTGATKAQLMEIMMAQDFQDLTGQVIKKVLSLTQDLESQLMGVLIETMPDERRTDSVNSLLNGPVINAEGRTDIVGNQAQVDDLLDSLGF